MHRLFYSFKSFFLQRKKEKVSTVLNVETLKAFLFNIITLGYDRLEGVLRPKRKSEFVWGI